MTQCTQRRKTGILLALLLPFTMLLSACKWDNVMEITPAGGMNFTVDLIDTEGLTAASGVTCDMMSDFVADDELFATATFEAEDISEGSNLGCRFVVTTPIADSKILVDNGDSLTLNIVASATDDMYIPGPDSLGPLEFTFSITMPGTIIDTSEGGQIIGNTVTFTDPSVLESGFSVTSQKSADPFGGSTWNDSNENPDAYPDPSHPSSNGTSLWAWFFVGGAVLMLISVGIVFLLKKGRDSNEDGYPHSPYSRPS